MAQFQTIDDVFLGLVNVKQGSFKNAFSPIDTPVELNNRGWTLYHVKQRNSEITGTPYKAGEVYHGTSPDSLVSVLRCGLLPPGCPSCDGFNNVQITNGNVGAEKDKPPIYLSPSLGVASIYAKPFLSGTFLCQVVLQMCCWKEPSKIQKSTLDHVWSANDLGYLSPGMMDEKVEWLYNPSEVNQVEIISVLIRQHKIGPYSHINFVSSDIDKTRAVLLHIIYTHNVCCGQVKCKKLLELLKVAVTYSEVRAKIMKSKYYACFYHGAEELTAKGENGILLLTCLVESGGNHNYCDPNFKQPDYRNPVKRVMEKPNWKGEEEVHYPKCTIV